MKTIRYSFILTIIFILFYFIPASTRLLWQPDETRYAEISREMLTMGDWIVPHLLGVYYLEKPIVGYWINNIGQLVFGNSNFAVRVGSIFSTFLTLLLIIWLTWKIWKDKHTVFLASIIFLTSLIVCGIGTYAILDSVILFWLTVSMCSFWISTQVQKLSRKIGSYLTFGISCGMGVITKGFIALAIPIFSIIPWIVYKRLWKEIILFGWLAVLSCIFSILPWGLAINYRSINFWYYFFWIEHIQRFFQSNAQHIAPFWFYLPCLFIGSLPWITILPGTIFYSWHKKDINQNLFYLLSWTIMPLLFFSLSKGKLLTYILPCFTPLSILMANYIIHTIDKENFSPLRINAFFNILLGIFGIIIVFILSPFGIIKNSIWTKIEIDKIYYSIIAFLVWILVSWFSLKKIRTYWWLIAFCPLGIILLVGNIIPNKIIYFKQPQFLVKTFYHSLQHSRFILANNVGIASGLAWELKRSDIIMYKYKGELEYGLNHSNLKERYVSEKDFKSWLEKYRYQGSVSLILLLSKDNDIKKVITSSIPDKIYLQGRIAYIKYYMLFH